MPAYPAEAAAGERQLARAFSPLFLSSCGSDIPRQGAGLPGCPSLSRSRGECCAQRQASGQERGSPAECGKLAKQPGGVTRIRTIRPLATAPEWLTWPATGGVSGGSTLAEASMSRTGGKDEPGTRASSPLHRPPQAAPQVRPPAARLTPLPR